MPRRAARVHHSRHDPALAPRYRPPPLGRQVQTEEARAATDPPAIVRLVLRMAAGNEHCGYRRIAGELAGLGIDVAPSTVWEILKRHGIDPAPRPAGPGWAQFPRSQAEALLAADFVVIDLLDGTKASVLAVIEHATRRVRVLGATAHPVREWVVQQARNLVMDLQEADTRARFLLHDRDASFCAALDQVLTDARSP